MANGGQTVRVVEKARQLVASNEATQHYRRGRRASAVLKTRIESTGSPVASFRPAVWRASGSVTSISLSMLAPSMPDLSACLPGWLMAYASVPKGVSRTIRNIAKLG